VTALVACETLLLVVLVVLVAGLLRSHAEILRRLGPPDDEDAAEAPVLRHSAPARPADQLAAPDVAGATLAGVRGVLGPLLGGLVIWALGVRAVYLVALALMAGAAWLVARESGRHAVVYCQS